MGELGFNLEGIIFIQKNGFFKQFCSKRTA